MRIFLIRFLMILFLLCTPLFYTTVHAADAINTPESYQSGLMQQGKIRNCLKPVSESHTRTGATATDQIHLTGTCGSPTGCACQVCWGLNTAVANFEEFDSCTGVADKIVASVRNLINWAKNGKDPDAVKRDRAVHCSHGKNDLKNPTLANIKPGCRPCTIIQNNSGTTQAKAGSAESNVLGTTNDSVLAQGNVDILVQEDTYRHTPYDFASIGDGITVASDTGTGGTEVGDDSSLKQASLDFFTQTSQVTGNNKSCSTFSWDPYGRVFDAVSLEPISDVEVTLLDATTKKPYPQSYFPNNDVTGEDGLYNIQVEKEGRFIIAVNPASQHELVVNPTIHSNWSKIYSDLYVPDKTFDEKYGEPTHFDIALMPKGEPYHGAVAEPVIGTTKTQNMGNTVVYMGRVSFPYASVCLVDTGTAKQVGACVNADNAGQFVLSIDKNSVPQTRTTLSVTKVDLTKLTATGPLALIHERSSAAADVDKPQVVTFEPILSYVEGYAYRPDGSAISNARVVVTLAMNDEPFLTTQADTNGFFSIPTNKLPYVEYYFTYVDPVTKGATTRSASKFAADNKSYLEEEGINLMAGTIKGKPVSRTTTTHKTSRPAPHIQSDPVLSTPIPTGSTLGVSPATQAIYILVGVILLLLVVAGGVLFYLKNNSTRT